MTGPRDLTPIPHGSALLPEAVRVGQEDRAVGTLVSVWLTPALPWHFVGEDTLGALWLFPCSPAGPAAWQRRTPYRGYRRGLRPAVLQATLVRLYGGGGG